MISAARVEVWEKARGPPGDPFEHLGSCVGVPAKLQAPWHVRCEGIAERRPSRAVDVIGMRAAMIVETFSRTWCLCSGYDACE